MARGDANDPRPGHRRWLRGQAMVEFPGVIFYWIGLVFGITSACLGVYGYSFVSQASRDGVRYAMVRGSDLGGGAATADDVASFVLAEAHGFPSGSINVATTWTPDNKPGSIVKVTVTYNYQPIYPISSATLPLTSSAQMVVTY
jgi:hypothetical protein